MMRRRQPSCAGRWGAAAAIGALLVVAAPVRAEAQTAAKLYERAVVREKAVTSNKAATVDAIRGAAKAYEAIVLRYPASGFCDNALWQAAGLMKLAYERSADTADRERVDYLIAWLRREYPSSSLIKDADERLAALGTVAVDTPVAEPLPPMPAPQPPLPAARQGAAATLRSISREPLPRGERIIIELSHEVVYSGDRVVNPDRVFFDLANVTAAAGVAERAQNIKGDLVQQLRLGRHPNGVTRVVLQLAGSPRYSAFPLYGPFRLVIDLETDGPPATPAVSPTAPKQAAAPPKPAPDRRDTASKAIDKPETTAAPARTPDPAPAPTPAPAPPAITSKGEYSMARQLGLGVSRIVIDAGHGGHDPGAQANGLSESEVVLDVALRLEKLLKQQSGFDVVLTRRTDQFIPLEERTAIANREKADLFLSIHANASRQSAAHGVETYFLNFATNPAAEAVAARENATSAHTMGTLPAILRAIALNNKLDESREVATILQTSLARKLRAQNKSLRDLGVKQAPFVVLIGAQMPSVLAEISFLTNRAEASLLKQSAYRQHIAQAFCDAILKYRTSLKKVTTVATRSAER